MSLIVAAVLAASWGPRATAGEYDLDIEIAIAEAEASLAAEAAPSIRWVTVRPDDPNLWDARAAATEVDCRLWIHFSGGDSCAACKLQEKGMDRPEVIKASRRYVCVYVDVEKRRDIADAWNIREGVAMPLEVVCDPRTRYLTWKQGLIKPDQLAGFLRDPPKRGD
jgi:hypothetical protein